MHVSDCLNQPRWIELRTLSSILVIDYKSEWFKHERG